MERYEAACSAVHEVLGAHAKEVVERVDRDRAGRVVLTVTDDDGTNWFAHDGTGLHHLNALDDDALPVCASLRERNARVLAWRSGRRITAALEEDGSPVVVKGYRRRRVEGHAARHRLALTCGAAPGAFCVPRLLEVRGSKEALVFERLHGRPVQLDTMDAELFYRIGYALRVFQSEVPVADLERHGVDAEASVLETLSDRARELGVEVPAAWSVARDRWRESGLLLPERPAVATHRDLHDGQLLVVGREIALFDFDLLCAADPVLDAANLTAHLRLRSLQQLRGATEGSADACAKALLEGFGHFTDHERLAALRVYQAGTFLRLALVYLVRPRWSHLTPSLIELASLCLNELPRV